jgi:hypothetical protein
MKLLQRPYYFETSHLVQWKRSVFVGLFVFLFLVLFRPFGLQTFPGNLTLISLGYGAITFAGMVLLFQVVYRLFPEFFNEEKWTLGREILSTLFILAIIGMGNAIFSASVGIAQLNLETILWFEIYTVLVGIFPTITTVLIKEKMMSKKFEEGSEEINKMIEPPHKAIKNTIPLPVTYAISLLLPSDNGKEDLQLKTDDFLFVRAADNYAEVYFLNGSKVNKKVIRTSLKAIVNSLVENKECYRCHKSYVINLSKVNHVSGNAQGYKLHLQHVEDLIPVSRKLNEEIKGILEGRGRK